LPWPGLPGDGCRRAHDGLVHASSLAASGRYNKHRTEEQRPGPMSNNESRKFGMTGAFRVRPSL
jgi:hypothetical protein